MNIQLADKKDAILISTLDLIQEHGFHGTPMSLIAKHARVSVGTVYHYFSSKDELILELFRYCKTQLTRFLFDNLEESCSYEIRFKMVWKRFISFYIQNPSNFRFLEQFYSSPFHEKIRMEKKNKTVRGIYQFLEEGIENQCLKKMDIELASAAYLGVAVSFVKAIVFGRVAFNAAHADEMVEIVWNSIRK